MSNNRVVMISFFFSYLKKGVRLIQYIDGVKTNLGSAAKDIELEYFGLNITVTNKIKLTILNGTVLLLNNDSSITFNDKNYNHIFHCVTYSKLMIFKLI